MGHPRLVEPGAPAAPMPPGRSRRPGGAESPGKDRESSWLPTPPGRFNLTLRNYWPREAAYDGTYTVPPVRKVP
jgi:hypothetical protein